MGSRVRGTFGQLPYPDCVYAYLTEKEDRFYSLSHGFFANTRWSLAKAQQFAFEMLIQTIGHRAQRILNFSNGFDASTARLADYGHSVTAIRPNDREIHHAVARRRTSRVKSGRHEEKTHETDREIDLMLFHESSHDIQVEDLFRQAAGLLKETGRVVILDQMAVDTEEGRHAMHPPRRSYLEHAENSEFFLDTEEDFTDLAAPTKQRLCDLLCGYRADLLRDIGISDEKIDALIGANEKCWELYRSEYLVYRALLFRRRRIRETVQIRPYRIGDEVAIDRLFDGVFHGSLSGVWKWKFLHKSNKSFAILAFRRNELVAHYTGLPRTFIEGGKIVAGVQVCDVMVHASARGQMKLDGPFASTAKSFIRRYVGQDKQFQLSYGFPSRRHLRLATTLGLYDEVTPLMLYFREKPRKYRRLGFSIDEIKTTRAAEIDRLWNAMRQDFHDDILGVRDSDYIEWRYLRHPVHQYKFLGIKRFGGQRSTAIAMVREMGDRVVVVDILAKRGWFGEVMRFIEAYCANIGVPRIEVFISGGFAGLFKGIGFDCVETDISIPRIRWEGDRPIGELRDRLYITMGDSDLY